MTVVSGAPSRRRALLGATANKLLHLAERPVLMVPAPAESG
jgi:nucleotide-binding universal stress UspA family protein